jgi:DNA-binding IclR family transcriptional regulator
VLRHLAARGDFGWRLLDLSAQCEIDRPTTHRILKVLVRERLAEQRETDKRYIPGPLLFELGVSQRASAAFVTSANAPLARLVKRFGGLAYLCLRSGPDFVCVARVGQRVTATIEVGARGPLITSVGGIAILTALPKDESKPIILQNLKQVSRFDEARIRSLKAVLRRSQTVGFGLSEGAIVSGVGACGVPIRDKREAVFASITVVVALEDFAADRIPKIVAELEDQARLLERDAASVLR